MKYNVSCMNKARVRELAKEMGRQMSDEVVEQLAEVIDSMITGLIKIVPKGHRFTMTRFENVDIVGVSVKDGVTIIWFDDGEKLEVR